MLSIWGTKLGSFFACVKQRIWINCIVYRSDTGNCIAKIARLSFFCTICLSLNLDVIVPVNYFGIRHWRFLRLLFLNLLSKCINTEDIYSKGLWWEDPANLEYLLSKNNSYWTKVLVCSLNSSSDLSESDSDLVVQSPWQFNN